jgi:hypothetical protein
MASRRPGSSFRRHPAWSECLPLPRRVARAAGARVPVRCEPELGCRALSHTRFETPRSTPPAGGKSGGFFWSASCRVISPQASESACGTRRSLLADVCTKNRACRGFWCNLASVPPCSTHASRRSMHGGRSASRSAGGRTRTAAPGPDPPAGRYVPGILRVGHGKSAGLRAVLTSQAEAPALTPGPLPEVGSESRAYAL